LNKKSIATLKVVELMASDEGILTEGVVQNQSWPTHYPKIDARTRGQASW